MKMIILQLGGGVLSVTVIAIGDRSVDPSSNPRRGCVSFDSLCLRINSPILVEVMSKIFGRQGSFDLVC